MAGRFSYLLMAGGAVVAGMALQGDLNFNSERHDERRVERHVDRAADRPIDRSVDRVATRETIRDEKIVERDMADAIEELVRAESSLISARLDDNLPAAARREAEARRTAARAAVERLSIEVEAASQSDRDAVRERVRDSVRESVRDAVRS